jgi:hypothetical protein
MVTMHRPRLRSTTPRRPSTHGLDIRGLQDTGTPLGRDTVGTPVIGRGRRIRAHAGMLRAITTIATIRATGAATNETVRVSAA